MQLRALYLQVLIKPGRSGACTTAQWYSQPIAFSSSTRVSEFLIATLCVTGKEGPREEHEGNTGGKRAFVRGSQLPLVAVAQPRPNKRD